MQDISPIKKHILEILGENLSPQLTYHGIGHTLDVEEQCMILAKEEGITDNQQLFELHLASLYHDAGFMYAHTNHEIFSCEMARKQLPVFGIDTKTIENVCNIILATRFPHEPRTHLDRIICDADLDYLGRIDFAENSELLRIELLAYGIINPATDWNAYQIDFFGKHRYFTQSAKSKRDTLKNTHFQALLSASNPNTTR